VALVREVAKIKSLFFTFFEVNKIIESAVSGNKFLHIKSYIAGWPDENSKQ
jgi:hypothetical protein